MNSATCETQHDHCAISDEDLIHLALAGDSSGHRQLVDRYYARLYRTILRDEGCPYVAEDIVQDAFLKAFRRLETFRHNCQFFSWLYRIASNARFTYHRKNSRVSLFTSKTDPTHHSIDDQDSPEQVLQRQEDRETVQNALAGLAERYRRILVLREFEQLDYNTIAQILNIQLGTVRSRLHRARLRLRDQIESSN